MSASLGLRELRVSKTGITCQQTGITCQQSGRDPGKHTNASASEAQLQNRRFRPAEEIAKVRAQIEQGHGVRTLYCGADLRHPAEIEQMMAQSVEAFGAVDILVNNAVFRHADPVE